MSKLLQDFREMIKGDSSLGGESTFVPCYKTGFDAFDYRNGQFDEEGELNIGIDGGKIIMLVGKSGTGKTTFAIQAGCNIVDQFEEAQMIHLDAERATKKARIAGITRWNKEKMKQKYIHMDSGICSEQVYKLIKSVASLKISQRKELEIPSGRYDDEGNEIMVLPPTVILLDSLAVLAPKNIEEEDTMSGSMSATAIAKVNAALFKRIVGHIKDANIIFMVINHINQKIEINPMMKTQSDVNFLKQDETLPGRLYCLAIEKSIEIIFP